MANTEPVLDLITKNLPTCGDCKGSGLESDSGVCKTCGGIGLIPTNEGALLIDMFRCIQKYIVSTQEAAK
jgi:DnaJ-class molecular chaperone